AHRSEDRGVPVAGGVTAACGVALQERYAASGFRRSVMANANEPVLLELAHLPREQVGPFLLLGLDKDAGKEHIEANWAERIKWARKQQTNLTLEEINWARELLTDPARRLAADATSL